MRVSPRTSCPTSGSNTRRSTWTTTPSGDSPEIVVFVGPSLDAEIVASLLASADIRPPIARGDLRAVRADGARIAVVIDGQFAHTLAVSPREVIDVIRSGALVIGSSSMGAIRAAECAPAGMIGIGQVYEGYRDGSLSSDDEVAVVTNPDDGHRATSVPLVTVRAALRHARSRGNLSADEAETALENAASLHFSERTWPRILRDSGLDRPDVLRVLNGCPDPKREDAVAVLTYVASRRDELLERTTPNQTTFAGDDRYPGHDPLLGYAQADLQIQLLRWLVASGRLHRYVPSIVAGEPEFAMAARVWSTLESVERLQAEILLFHAVRESGNPPEE